MGTDPKAHILPELKWICEGQRPRLACVHPPGKEEGCLRASVQPHPAQTEWGSDYGLDTCSCFSSSRKALGRLLSKASLMVCWMKILIDCSGFPSKSFHPRPPAVFSCCWIMSCFQPQNFTRTLNFQDALLLWRREWCQLRCGILPLATWVRDSQPLGCKNKLLESPLAQAEVHLFLVIFCFVYGT